MSSAQRGSPHTPGPWSIPHFAGGDTFGGCECGYVYSESQQGMGAICQVFFGGENEPREIAEANARLIAAAPDLLAALDALVTACEVPGENCEVEQALPAAIAAIATATGRTA